MNPGTGAAPRASAARCDAVGRHARLRHPPTTARRGSWAGGSCSAFTTMRPAPWRSWATSTAGACRRTRSSRTGTACGARRSLASRPADTGYKVLVDGERWTEDRSHGLKEDDGYGGATRFFPCRRRGGRWLGRTPPAGVPCVRYTRTAGNVVSARASIAPTGSLLRAGLAALRLRTAFQSSPSDDHAKARHQRERRRAAAGARPMVLINRTTGMRARLALDLRERGCRLRRSAGPRRAASPGAILARPD